MASGTLDTPAGSAPPSRRPDGRAAIAARTLRTDNWRKAPVLTVVLLTAWIVISVVRVYMRQWYWVEDYHYLTPFYSPCISVACEPESALVGRFLPGMDTCRQSIRRNAWPFSICGRRLLCKRNVWPVIFFWMSPVLMRYVGVTITKAEETCVCIVPTTSGKTCFFCARFRTSCFRA